MWFHFQRAKQVLAREDQSKNLFKNDNTMNSSFLIKIRFLKEYETVMSMPGVGEILGPRIIAEIGDVRRFHSASALVAYAGLDAPPFQSGNYFAVNRSISKRGSASLRRTGYEIMRYLKIAKPDQDNAVYMYMIKKENEGKPLRVAKIAALNKFLHIYYARVKELYAA
jgi:transposase